MNGLKRLMGILMICFLLSSCSPAAETPPYLGVFLRDGSNLTPLDQFTGPPQETPEASVDISNPTFTAWLEGFDAQNFLLVSYTNADRIKNQVAFNLRPLQEDNMYDVLVGDLPEPDVYCFVLVDQLSVAYRMPNWCFLYKQIEIGFQTQEKPTKDTSSDSYSPENDVNSTQNEDGHNLESDDGSNGQLDSNPMVVSAGVSHTCAVTTTGGVKCWGQNESGQLGDGTIENRSVPVDVLGMASGITSVSAGNNYTCAITGTGGIKCWGSNDFGQLGDGTTEYRSVPVDVVGLASGIAWVSAGHNHTCALSISGGVKCWGGNESGQLGDGTTESRSTPVDVMGLSSGIKSVSAGGLHTCAVSIVGKVMCWGMNIFGELGNGTKDNNSTPVYVEELSSGIEYVATGGLHTCAVTTEGGAKCWGGNEQGELGDGTTNQKTTPVDVSGLSNGVVSVILGGLHTCAVTTVGGVKCWGWNDSGQIGDGTIGGDRFLPVDVVGIRTGILSISAGHSHNCAVSTAGKIICWGNNLYGQLGDGTTENRSTPIEVEGF